jgi:multiple sugar transport system ATP-binding protein
MTIESRGPTRKNPQAAIGLRQFRVAVNDAPFFSCYKVGRFPTSHVQESMAAVQIKAVEKYFGTTHIIRGVDIDMEDGQFTVLVGPSGCGKSTLLRMIAGLEEITRGDIVIGGRVVNNMMPKERDIAMVFQNYALYPHMTVRENMTFSLKLANQPKATADERVRKAADILGLNDLLERYPRQLSGGQRQRVAMGRCIVRDPQVFLFDEPLSNLDAKLRVQMRTEIKELHQRLKTTSIYVTHDQIEAMTMADKIVVMRDGIVEQTGSPLEVYDRPANQFVAGFIGSPAMNFLPGVLKRSGGQARVEFADGLSLPAPQGAAGSDGQRVVYGTRPEHMALAEGADGVPGEVVVVEPTGADTQVFTKLAGVEVTSVFRDRHAFRPGETIRLRPDPSRAHLFDAASGTRLAA